MKVGLQSSLIREAIQKKCPPSPIVVFYVPEIPPKVNGFVTLSGGGGSRKYNLVTLLRCHYWLGGVGVQGKSDNVTLYHGGVF